MRLLSQSLLRAQRARIIYHNHFLLKCDLSYGATSYSYTHANNKIKQLSDVEQIFSRRSQLLLEDADKVLHGRDLEGYKAEISYGLITRAGPEWISTAPLWVVGQNRDSYRTHLECNLELEGIFDRMKKQKAESTMTLPSTDTQTVKDLLTGIADGTITDGTNSPYSNYPAYTITFDSGYDDDGLIDVFIPADSFRIGLNESRLAKFTEVLRYTEAVARIGNDGAIHIFTPVTSGTTYDNEYSLLKGRDYHNFFNKRFRRRVVSPNYITFKNHPSHDDSYTGFAKDASADLTDMLERETHYARLVSNAQGTALAGALLSKYQMQAEKGAGVLPFVHLGQETYDYVNFNDAHAGDERAGNVGSISKLFRVYNAQPQLNMSIGFGRVPLGVAALKGFSQETGLSPENLMPIFDSLYSYIEQIIDILGYKVDIDVMNETLLALYEDAYFRKATVSQQLTIPSEAA